MRKFNLIQFKNVSYFSILLTFLFFVSCQNKSTSNIEKKSETKESCCEKEQDNTLESAVLGVKNILENQIKGWNNGHIDSFMVGYWNNESLKFITKNGIKFGYTTVSDSYKKSYPNQAAMGQLNFENLAFTPLLDNNSIINVTGRWSVYKNNQTESGLFSLIFKKIDNEWKIIIDHTW